MLFERSSEVSSFNRYMLPGIANKTDIAPALSQSLKVRGRPGWTTVPIRQR